MDTTTATTETSSTTNLFQTTEKLVTRLNFINRTDQANTLPVVVFQKNILLDFDQPSIAWKVIKHCERGDYHTFHFSPEYYMDTSDLGGEHSCKIPIQHGQVYELVKRESRECVNLKGLLMNPSMWEFENNLEKKPINANIYKNDKLVALYPSITPGMKTSFAFNSNIWIGVVEQAEEGQELTSKTVARVDTEIELDGIHSADIIMRNEYPESPNYRFHLENIVFQS